MGSKPITNSTVDIIDGDSNGEHEHEHGHTEVTKRLLAELSAKMNGEGTHNGLVVQVPLSERYHREGLPPISKSTPKIPIWGVASLVIAMSSLLLWGMHILFAS